jgi:hypothetical protein
VPHLSEPNQTGGRRAERRTDTQMRHHESNEERNKKKHRLDIVEIGVAALRLVFRQLLEEKKEVEDQTREE